MQRFAPDVEVALWPCNIGEAERELFARHFPDVRIIDGYLDDRGRASTAELRQAFADYDFLLHGSGPHAVAADDVRAWWHKTRKPYGFFGITVDPVSPPTEATLSRLRTMIDVLPQSYLDPAERDLYNNADFVYCRDSYSRDYLRNQGVSTPLLEFGPDATFTFDAREPERADEILRRYGLSDGEFLCLVPGLKWTPYYELRDISPDREALRREAIAAAFADDDMQSLTDVIVGWVRATGLPVLVCPEMRYQMELAERYWRDSLPEDVTHKVHILPEFWTPAVAASVYARSRLVMSIECHSPILAIAAGTPAIYVRQPTDTIKGAMYPDLGATDWIVEIEPGDGGALLALALDIHSSDVQSRAHARSVHNRAEQLLEAMARTVAVGATL